MQVSRQEGTRPISIFILAEEAIGREGLRKLLQMGSGLSVVGDAETVEETVAVLDRLTTAAVLIDLPLPICAVDATRKILFIAPAAHVIVLSRYADTPKVGEVVAEELRKAGASALLPKSSSLTELVECVQKVMRGDAVFPQPVGGDVLAAANRLSAPPIAQPSLTLRQTQVLKLVAEGFANKEIADRLSISAKTVEKHRQSVKEKLRTHNAADLARRAIGLGLVQAA